MMIIGSSENLPFAPSARQCPQVDKELHSDYYH